MSRRATIINLCNGMQRVVAGEPMLDADEGVLIIQFDDGTSRVFNWDHVADYYYLTAEEFADARAEMGENNSNE